LIRGKPSLVAEAAFDLGLEKNECGGRRCPISKNLTTEYTRTKGSRVHGAKIVFEPKTPCHSVTSVVLIFLDSSKEDW